jgi:hypothetical protein
MASPLYPYFNTYFASWHHPSRRALLTLTSVIVWSVSFLDHETGFQTSQTDLLVATVAVGVAQALRRNNSIIASTNGRLRAMKSVCIGFSLQLLPGIPASFAINGGDGDKNAADSREEAPYGRK